MDRLIAAHKRKMEVRLGRPVEKRESEMDYINTSLKGNAEDFRRGYCHKCPDRDKCGWHNGDA